MTAAREEDPGRPVPGAEPLARALAEVAARVPAPLAVFGDRLSAGPWGPGARPAAALRDRAVFDAAVDVFAAPFGASDRRAVVSYWTQFYLAALAIPAVTGLSHLGRALPLALDEVGFELDAEGRLARFHLPEDAWAGARAPDPGRTSGLSALVEGHLRPFVELCHAHSGLAPRVVWGNAAVMIDSAVEELRAAGVPVPAEAATLLGWRADWDSPRSPLAHTLRAAGPEGGRCRRVCCLRYCLPGVADCGALCPVRPAVRHPDVARTDRPC